MIKEVKSPLKAIRTHCIECVGSYSEVRECGGEGSCVLFPFRFGKNPFRKKTILSDERKNEMVEILKKARESKNCI